jgi:hypothetical protein
MPKPYIPKLGDPVLLEGVSSTLKVVSVDTVQKTATVSIPSTPGVVYIVPWSKVSPLDSSQNALRIVRDSTEGK